MEYVNGRSLANRLKSEPMAAHEAATLTVAVARAMQHAHSAGIVHRDLKPSNILITDEGMTKILDLGLALIVDGRLERDVTTAPGSFVGTPSYMSPEQVRGDIDAIGPATDVYALGTILYEMLAGRVPFKGPRTLRLMIKHVLEEKPEPPSRWRHDVSRDLDAICLKCLEKDSGRRYPTAAALADDLERFLEAKPAVVAGPPSIWKRIRHFFSFRK
jgi:serine/threonine protein kinase